MQREPDFDLPALPCDDNRDSAELKQDQSHCDEDIEIRWLTVIRSQVSEGGGKPTEKFLWVGFLD